MATSPQPPRGPDWRPGQPAPARPTPPAAGPAWRRLDATPTPLPPRVKAGRLAGILALVLATATALIWLLFWLRPPGPACLVLAGAGYEDNLALPHNAPGREAMGRLANLAGTSSPLSLFFRRSGRLRLVHAPTEVARGGDWAKGLDGAPEKTAIVFLALHGGADAKGAYLLPQDATGDEGDRIRLESILDRLAELPAGRYKLLILDATWLQANWTLGLLHNDFARALADLEEKIIAVPNLVVLSASDVDQRSWPTADLRLSLFVQHFMQSLVDRGGAHVNAWELYQAVARKVEADAQRLHGVTQTPVLLPRNGGEARARAIPMTFQLEESALEGDPVADPLPDITAAWAGYDAFRPRAPAAMACVPRDWSLWQAWLVRHEQLRLAGSPRAAIARERASEAEQRVRQGLDLELTSASLTLEMPAVQGETQMEVADPYSPMEQLWQAAPADRQATWTRLQQADASGMLRRNVLFALIRRAAENPARNLDRAADLAQLLDDPLRAARPAEAQFLVLLRRDLPVRPIPEELELVLRDALRLRLIAEEAALAVTANGYAYAERIRPWIIGTIAQADAARQRGEDLLFATGKAQWQKARDLLKDAAARYREALGDAAVLREALAACDRGDAELPLHAGWLSALPSDPDDALLKRAVALFGDVRRLEKMVQEALARREAAKVAEIRQLAQSTKEGLDLLQVRLDAYARTCESTRSAPLRDGGPVLQVPWLEAGVRERLVRKLSRLAKQARSEGETPLADSPDQLDELARRRAVREGRLALAALGAEWFDQPGKDRVPYGDVEAFVRRPDLEGAWSKVLRWAGGQIGERFRLYPSHVEALVREARKQQDVAGPLREADRLARRVDAGQWQRMQTDAPVLARKADVEELLVWQAGRTYSDHWYNDDPRGVPYYRITGLAYLRDARRLDPFGRADASGAGAVRKQLEAPDGLAVRADATRGMIAGDRLRMSAGVAGSVVTGYPVLWAELEQQLTFATPQDGGRAALSMPPSKDDMRAVTLTCPELERAEQSPPLDATPLQSECVWRAYYRGQKPSVTTAVNLYPVAESTRIDHAPPPQAGVAVRASDALFAQYGRAQGGLAIVMDCSGSEGPPGSAPEATRTRYRQAVQALRTILAQVPRGTRLSLWTFGQAVPPRNTVEKAEETIQRLREPAIWDGGDAAVEALVGQVAALEPWNQSPIARAVLRAREDVLKAEGFRAMIVLSDGDDNRFAADAEANPKKEPIAEVLTRRFAGTNVAIHMVGFSGKDGQPEADLINNFGFVTTRLPKGTISTVTHLGPVLGAIRQTMPAGLRYELTGGGLDAPSPEAVEVSRDYENDRWHLVPGSREGYRLKVPLLGFNRPLRLDDGDCLLLDLDKSNLGWRRLIWSRQPAFAMRPFKQSGGWRAAVLQDQQLGPRALQMLLTLERESPRSAEMGQVWPGGVWLEVAPSGVKALPAVSWGTLYGYPAPAWGVDAPGWPITPQGPPAPALRAWWGEPSAQSSLLLRPPGDLSGTQKIGKESFDVEGPRVEEHWVQVRPDRREKRWCYVVGARHDVGKPVWSQLEGVSGVAGQEHRHFLAAGRYVGLYWFRDAASEQEVRQKVERELTGMRFVSVPAFQEEAASRHESAAFTDLDTPAALPPRPRPVWPSQ